MHTSVEGNADQPGFFKKLLEAIYIIYMTAVVVGSIIAVGKMAADIVYHFGSIKGDFGALVRTSFGEKDDILFWICVAACLVTAIAVLEAGVVFFHFGLRLLNVRRSSQNEAQLENAAVAGQKKPRTDRSSFLKLCEKAVINTYDFKRFWDLDCLQAGLRALLVSYFVVAALASLLQRNISPAHDLKVIKTCDCFQVVVSGLYLLGMASLFFSNRQRLKALHAEKNDDLNETRFDSEVGLVFWRSAKWDLLYLNAIMVSTLFLRRPIYLAYILPLTGTWLFHPQHVRKALKLVMTGIIGHFCALAIVALRHPEVAAKLGYGDHFPLLLLWETFPSVAFWLILALALLTLRHVRAKAKSKTSQLEANIRQERTLRLGLDRVGTKQGLGVFIKNEKRQIISANDIFLEMMAPVAIKNGWPLTEEGRARWQDIELKTDDDLGIPCAVYTESDRRVLESKGGVTDHYESYEPPFCHNVSIRMLWVVKETVRDANGKVVGLVGYILPGLPVEMARLSEYLMDELRIYASMKDAEGHVVWANQHHLEELSLRIHELLDISKLPPDELLELKKLGTLQAKLKAINSGRGPTDVDLYGENSGRYYSDMDALIMHRAREHAQKGGTPKDFEAVMMDLIRQWRPNQNIEYPKQGWIERHHFPGQKDPIWVEVWKAPWWEERIENNRKVYHVRGVLVYFRDIDERYVKLHLKNINPLEQQEE